MSLSEEESFFLRFYYLNLKVATKAVRVYFNSVHPPAGLANELANSSATLKGLRFITSPQMLTLYPSPASNVRSDDFDTTLIVCLLRNMAPRERTPITGWDNLPHPGDTSTGADLARVKWYRNILAHHDDGKLTPTEFSMGWGELECAIGRLGGPSLLREAQSAQHIVLDKSLIDILNSLYDLQMSKVEHTSILHNLQSAINNQTTIKEEQEIKIQQLNDSLLEGTIGAQKLAADFTDIQRTIQICTLKIETCRRETDQIECRIQVMQGKWMKKEEKLDVLTQQLLSIECKYDIKFEEIDVRLAEQDGQMAKHGAQMTKQDERITQQDQLMAACVKDIDNMKITQSDTDYSSEGRKRKRLEDDTKALIAEDIREDTFVITKAVADSISLLKQNGVLLITGYAGTGKSRISRHVLHMYCTDDMSYNCIKLNALDEWEDMVSRDGNVVVLLDDIFGETNCIYSREKDTPIIDKVYAHVCKGNIKVIITIRDTVKGQCQEVFDSHRLFKFDCIDLSSDRYKLSWNEKACVLEKYMNIVRQSDFVGDAGFVDCNGVTILKKDEALKIINESPVKGFPLAIYQFVNNAKYFQLGSIFFDRPTMAMLEEMNEIRCKGKNHWKYMLQYAVMVYTAIHENCIYPDEGWDRGQVEKIINAIYGKTIKLKNCDIPDAVTELKGSYLVIKTHKRSYGFHHQTLQESVILSFAQIDEGNMENIIPLLSWSFFLKMVKSDEYLEKEGEVVLKIPPNSYELLAYRLVDMYLAKIGNSFCDRYCNCFLAEVIDTEVFQQKTTILLTYLLKAFEDKTSDNFKKMMTAFEYLLKSMMYEVDSCDENLQSKPVFLANLLISIAQTERRFKVYNFILQKCNQIVEAGNNYATIDYMKAALITSLYEICSTKDVSCVKATFNLINGNKITVLLDQGINLTTLGLTPLYSFTSGYSYNDNHNCVFLMYCIWKAYETFNEPVLVYLLSMYNKIPFDVNLLLKTFYSTDWVEELTSLSHKPLKWLIERFEDQALVDTDFILRTACRYQMCDTVEYLASRCSTFDAISCLEHCLYEAGVDNDPDFSSNFNFNEDCFKFLFPKIDITSPKMNCIVIAILQKPNVPDYVCEAILPFCINNEAMLTLACREAHFYITKLILEASDNVNIQSALITACIEKNTNFWSFLDLHEKVKNLEIVKFIVGKYGYEQFDLKVVCRQAFRFKQFKILEWFSCNIDINLLDVHCIMNSALVDRKPSILECIINNTSIASLDTNEVLKSVTEHYSVVCSTKILQIVSIIWNCTENKEKLKMEEIVVTAYEKRCFELIIWIRENCNSYIFIDAMKVLMLACEDGRTDVSKWIFKSYVKTSLDFNEGKLLMLACDTMSNNIYDIRKISMVKWVIENVQVKPFNLKLGLLKLLGHAEYQIWEVSDDFFELVVSILKKCLNFLSIDDKNDMVNKCLKQKHYYVLNWFLENEKCCLLDKQNILNEACRDSQLQTIYMLNEYLHSLDTNEAVINACTVNNLETSSVCDYLLKETDDAAVDIRRIVNCVCENYVSDNAMKWILLKFSHDQNAINKVLISCCRQGKFNLLKYIFLIVPNEQLDILTAFVDACLHPKEQIQDSEQSLCVIDFLFQKLQYKSFSSSDVLNGLLDKKRYDVILYFLEQGYCRNVDMSNLLIEVCKKGHVKLLQWILDNVDHKELDIKSAFLEACIPTDMVTELQLKCVALMWHYIQDINMFDVDTVLKSMNGAPPYMLDIDVQDDLRKWLLYIKNIHQRMMPDSEVKL
ncbi:uncharacterized protein [Mytilus edulis]|uniref:uncharacterized protein n=1 Tax=Mytilus edulis TaxID=6550 RepID=UPI0039F06A42